MEKIGNITKNTSYFTFALILQKFISFSYFTILARNLGPENLGKYYFAISFTTVFAIFTDIGMANLLTREVAKKKDNIKNLLGSVLAIKLPLAIITILTAIIISHFTNNDPLIKNLIYISLACVILDSFTTTFWAVSRGLHNLLFESISSVIFQLIIMIIGLFFLYKGFGLNYIMLAILSASIFHFIYSSLVLIKKFKVAIVPVFDIVLIKKMFLVTVPFGLFAVFQRLYMHLDSVLLGALAGNEYVGYYQISFKIIFALQFLPMAFVASLYPAMSDFWENNKQQLKITFEKALVYLILISIPISAGVLALADKIVLIFKNDYHIAILPMQVIILSLVFMFVNFPIGSLLNACNQQKKNTKNMIIATVVSIAMNLVLITKYQTLGASITVLFTNILMVILGFYWVIKIIDFDKKKVIVAFLKILLSASIMGVFVFLIKESIQLFVLIPLGAVIYFFLLFIVKVVKKDEVAHIYHSFLRK